MKNLIVHLVITALLLVLVSHFVPGIQVGGFGYALLAAFVLGIVNGIIRPLLILITLPATLLTLGLFLFVINALMLMLTGAIVPGFTVTGFVPAIYGGFLLALFNLVASSVLNK